MFLIRAIASLARTVELAVHEAESTCVSAYQIGPAKIVKSRYVHHHAIATHVEMAEHARITRAVTSALVLRDGLAITVTLHQLRARAVHARTAEHVSRQVVVTNVTVWKDGPALSARSLLPVHATALRARMVVLVRVATTVDTSANVLMAGKE